MRSKGEEDGGVMGGWKKGEREVKCAEGDKERKGQRGDGGEMKSEGDEGR